MNPELLVSLGPDEPLTDELVGLLNLFVGHELSQLDCATGTPGVAVAPCPAGWVAAVVRPDAEVAILGYRTAAAPFLSTVLSDLAYLTR